MNKKNLIIGIVVALAVAGIIYYAKSPLGGSPAPTPSAAKDAFAQCIKDKGVTMYGAAWCSHCQAQKKLFGDSFKNISYVECPDNTQLCVDKGVEGYPTWIASDGQKYVGEQSFEELSKISGCPVPTP